MTIGVEYNFQRDNYFLMTFTQYFMPSVSLNNYIQTILIVMRTINITEKFMKKDTIILPSETQPLEKTQWSFFREMFV